MDTINGGAYRLELPDIDDSLVNWLKSGRYEVGNTKRATKILKPGDTAIDVGASFGHFSILFSKLVGDAGTVLAFEPSKMPAEYLAINKHINKCHNLIIYPLAVGAELGTMPLYENPGNVGNTGKFVSGRYLGDVVMVPLSLFIQGHIKLLKIDTEGQEFEIFKSIQSKMQYIDNILFEYTNRGEETLQDHITLLISHGFEVRYPTGRRVKWTGREKITNLWARRW